MKRASSCTQENSTDMMKALTTSMYPKWSGQVDEDSWLGSQKAFQTSEASDQEVCGDLLCLPLRFGVASCVDQGHKGMR